MEALQIKEGFEKLKSRENACVVDDIVSANSITYMQAICKVRNLHTDFITTVKAILAESVLIYMEGNGREYFTGDNFKEVIRICDSNMQVMPPQVNNSDLTEKLYYIIKDFNKKDCLGRLVKVCRDLCKKHSSRDRAEQVIMHVYEDSEILYLDDIIDTSVPEVIVRYFNHHLNTLELSELMQKYNYTKIVLYDEVTLNYKASVKDILKSMAIIKKRHADHILNSLDANTTQNVSIDTQLYDAMSDYIYSRMPTSLKTDDKIADIKMFLAQ